MSAVLRGGRWVVGGVSVDPGVSGWVTLDVEACEGNAGVGVLAGVVMEEVGVGGNKSGVEGGRPSSFLSVGGGIPSTVGGGEGVLEFPLDGEGCPQGMSSSVGSVSILLFSLFSSWSWRRNVSSMRSGWVGEPKRDISSWSPSGPRNARLARPKKSPSSSVVWVLVLLERPKKLNSETQYRQKFRSELGSHAAQARGGM